MAFAFDFTGRHAIVTGASSGIGAHLAELLAAQGIRGLALAARRRDRLSDIAERCRAAGAGSVMTIALDVTDPDSVKAGIAEARASLGGLDLVANNAGIAEAAKALDTDIASFDRVLDANLRGAWCVAVEAARGMVAAGHGGDIVNTASILGLRVASGLTPYAISKAGVVQMTRALAVEWARHGIRVNALAPGYFDTDINREYVRSEAGQAMAKSIPMRRIGQLAELHAPFLLLASGASAYLTGAVLTVDGGHHINPL
jgi:NAD(P)-dependent dehydrogenase (short-subunit alcohol dehydrogenase family)